ncbi:MAG: hypothetical protein IJ456_02810 [Bacteroides sp.]|nr:hypothetical protein [Bacteroides sp.]
MESHAQKALQRRQGISRDSIQKQIIREDSLFMAADSIDRRNQEQLKELEAPVDTTALLLKKDSTRQELTVHKERFVPNPNRAVWLALVIPGAGQIYNRKYWKLPLVYGGFVGCAYALNWNSMMYKDYSQAYLDIMDDDPNTKSYEDFLPPSANISGQESRYQEIFRKRKDLYRRQRDLSIFCFIGVYLLSVIDAYVDAELSNFDISKDIGLKVEPTIFNDGRSKTYNSVGLQCSLKF